MDERKLEQLKKKLEGALDWSDTTTRLYATDASAYRQIPQAVAIPKTEKDIQLLIQFANENSTSLIPRTAGTSLAGQVVGEGIVVDVSRYFTEILEINAEEQWVRVQPGIIRDDLNKQLKHLGLFFAPETSTSNRAMIGGMIGNNSCGANSIVYGSTRDHLLEVRGFLSDGSEVVFGETDLLDKISGEENLEIDIYKTLNESLGDPDVRERINASFPKPTIHRRNTGYAIDLLAQCKPFEEDGSPLNLCKLIAGSEGTLLFITEAKLHLELLPPSANVLLAAHFESVYESLEANILALNHNPTASELMDHYILDCTRDNPGQAKNRFFVKGEPKALLITEFRAENEKHAILKAEKLKAELEEKGLGYHFPIIGTEDSPKVWELRKAGLGLLSNIKGDAKPVPVVEDTAVDVNDLPAYVKEFDDMMAKHGLYCVHYAHAGSGELHLRPIIDLKKSEGQELFRTVLKNVAQLVKKYNGSLSGEHGDGRLRGEFIPYMIGDENYALLKKIKNSWDPKHIFNPGKITDTPPMNTSLRYASNQETRDFDTILDFTKNDGILRAAEQCNGSGDCRKTILTGGVMCPSYMVTKNEKDTTRARANILREILTTSTKANPFDSEEIMDVMDLCISCKGCKSECPSSVDVTKLKQEFLHQYHQSKGIPLKTRLIGKMDEAYQKGSRFPSLFNFFIRFPLTKKLMGFSAKRSLPKVKPSFMNWLNSYEQIVKPPNREVYLFIDEFTNYMDIEIGMDTVMLLNKLGYKVNWLKNSPSGRTSLSKGMLSVARKQAKENVLLFSDPINEKTPLIGIEPSAILSFRDEYPDLLRGADQEKARELAKHVNTFDEFIYHEFKKGNIREDQFHMDFTADIKVHGHCFQKALSSVNYTTEILSIPRKHTVSEISSGCCGMAGSFGYEKEHFDLSMKIGELKLFPEIRKSHMDTLIAAPGFSCRHQINDGTGKTAYHPATLLLQALKFEIKV